MAPDSSRARPALRPKNQQGIGVWWGGGGAGQSSGPAAITRRRGSAQGHSVYAQPRPVEQGAWRVAAFHGLGVRRGREKEPPTHGMASR